MALYEKIDKAVEKFIFRLVDHNVETFSESISELLELMNEIPDIKSVISPNVKLVEKMVGTYETISDILTVNSHSLGNLLIGIGDNHYHQHTDTDGIKYSCQYHMEKLQSHLMMASLIVCHEFYNHTSDDDIALILTFTALFHDVGKKHSCIYHRKEKAIGYPMHGEMGCGVMLSQWDDRYKSWFTREQWEDMCRTISVHMCGYHETDKTRRHVKQKWDMLSTERTLVKTILPFLSIGDHFAAVRSEKVKEDPAVYYASRSDLILHLSIGMDWATFITSNKLKSKVIFLRSRVPQEIDPIYLEVMAHLKRFDPKLTFMHLDSILGLDKVTRHAQLLKGLESETLVLYSNKIYTDAIDTLFPEEFKNVIRIAIDLVNESNFDTSYGWLDKSYDSRFKKLSSLFVTYSLSKDMKKEYIKPHLVHVLYKPEPKLKEKINMFLLESDSEEEKVVDYNKDIPGNILGMRSLHDHLRIIYHK